jgi:hypothetical protein
MMFPKGLSSKHGDVLQQAHWTWYFVHGQRRQGQLITLQATKMAACRTRLALMLHGLEHQWISILPDHRYDLMVGRYVVNDLNQSAA